MAYGPAIPLVSIYRKELETGTQTDTCTQMFIVAVTVVFPGHSLSASWWSCRWGLHQLTWMGKSQNQDGVRGKSEQHPVTPYTPWAWRPSMMGGCYTPRGARQWWIKHAQKGEAWQVLRAPSGDSPNSQEAGSACRGSLRTGTSLGPSSSTMSGECCLEARLRELGFQTQGRLCRATCFRVGHGSCGPHSSLQECRPFPTLFLAH